MIARHGCARAPVIHQRGCSYVSCEDVAERHVVVPADPVAADVFLCAMHEPFVRRVIGDPKVGQVVVLEGDPGDRRRVTVWTPPAGP